MPDIRPENFSCTRASTFRTASFTAAAIRSSSISLSSPSVVASICTARTSCRPFIVTRTIPPPDSPWTSSWPSSACAFCMSACICCACFIRFPSPGFMVLLSCTSVERLDRVGDKGGAQSFLERPHGRIVLEFDSRRLQSFLRSLRQLARRRLRRFLRELDLQLHFGAQHATQRARQSFFRLIGAKVCTSRIQQKP